MDFITHGIEGGLLLAIPFLWTQLTIVTFTLFAIGFITGAWPDIYPWYRWKFFGESRWDATYALYHHRWRESSWRFVPPFLLHVAAVDPPFHEEEGNWWPREWKRCCIHWGISIVGLLILFL